MTDYNPYLSEYDKKKIDEAKQANPAAFWLAYPFVVVGGFWLLGQFLDWANR